MSQHELSPTLAKYLDRHLVLTLLEFLQEKALYSENDLMKAKLELLKHTNMVDFAMDIHKALSNTETAPESMKVQRAEVVARLRQLQHTVEPVLKCLENPNVIRNFRQDKTFNLQFLQEEFQIGPDHVEALYQYAKFQFECGNYSLAADLLQPYRALCTSNERNISALWGKLASEILMQNIDTAREDIFKLRDAIDNQTFAAPLVQLQQRTWLLHWSLYVFWTHDNGKNDLLDLFMSPPYLAAIQINAQHLLRYMAAAAVVNKRKRSVLKELIKVIQQESYEYSDPLTQFLESLFVNYDFDGAQQQLKECEEVIENDFFLTNQAKEEFVENARLFIFETYCRIHQTIDIKLLAERLNMGIEAAEKWVTNLILNARLNARIDAKSGTVVMGTQSESIHEQLVEKARQLSSGTFVLANTVVGTAR